MIAITILSVVVIATVAAQYNNGIETGHNKLYGERDTKDEEKNLEINYEEENDYEVVEQEIIVAVAERPREVTTRNAPPRNNNEALSLLIEEPIAEPIEEQSQIIYMDASGMLSLVNAERANYGLHPLVWSHSLTESARIRASEITVLFSHTRPDGRAWNTVGNSVNGENIAARQRTIEIAFRAWMESPSHRENILSHDFRSIGISGVHSPSTEHTYYWVQLFGR